MAEDVGDLLQSGSAQSHLRRGRSSQGMGTQGAATQATTNERLLDAIRKDQSLEQAANIAMLPGIVGRALAMPDIHQGYGFPIGGVAAVDEQPPVLPLV